MAGISTTDISGNGVTTTLTGSPSTVTGPFGEPVAVFGDGQHTTAGPDVSSWTEISLTFWKNTPPGASFSKYWVQTNGFLRQRDNGGVQFRPSSSGSWYDSSAANWDLEGWHHITVTYSDTDHVARFYQDGVLIDTSGVLVGDIAWTSITNIGKGHGTEGDFISIGYIAAMDSVLDPAQIATLAAHTDRHEHLAYLKSLNPAWGVTLGPEPQPVDMFDRAGTLLNTKALTQNPVPDRTSVNYNFGYSFTLSESKTVYGLGRFIGSTFNDSHPIGVYRESDQALMASGTVSPTSDVVDGHAAVRLGTPVQLPAGDYRIVSLENGQGDNFKNDSGGLPTSVSGMTVTSACHDGGAGGGTSLAYPVNETTSAGAYVWPVMFFSTGAGEATVSGGILGTAAAPIGTGLAVSLNGGDQHLVPGYTRATGKTEITIEGWVKNDNPKSGHNVLYGSGTSFSSGNGLILSDYFNGTLHTLYLYAGAAGAVLGVTGFAPSEWRHIALTIDTAAGDAYAYVDGTLVDSLIGHTFPTYDLAGSYAAWLGSRSGNAAYHAPASMFGWAEYEAELSASDIAALAADTDPAVHAQRQRRLGAVWQMPLTNQDLTRIRQYDLADATDALGGPDLTTVGTVGHVKDWRGDSADLGAGVGSMALADKPLDGRSQWAVAGWAKWEDNGQTDYAALWGAWASANADESVLLWQNQTTGNLEVNVRTAAQQFSGTLSGPDMTDERWHHAAVEYDGQEVRMYFDGQLILAAALTGAMQLVASPPSLGVSTHLTGSGWNGRMSGWSVYNAPLGPRRVAGLAAYAPTGEPSVERMLQYARPASMPDYPQHGPSMDFADEGIPAIVYAQQVAPHNQVTRDINHGDMPSEAQVRAYAQTFPADQSWPAMYWNIEHASFKIGPDETPATLAANLAKWADLAAWFRAEAPGVAQSAYAMNNEWMPGVQAADDAAAWEAVRSVWGPHITGTLKAHAVANFDYTAPSLYRYYAMDWYAWSVRAARVLDLALLYGLPVRPFLYLKYHEIHPLAGEPIPKTDLLRCVQFITDHLAARSSQASGDLGGVIVWGAGHVAGENAIANAAAAVAAGRKAILT